VHTDPHLERLSDQVKSAPHNTDSKNLLEHHPPQRQELPGTDGNTVEAPNRPLRTNLLGQDPTSHINLLIDIKVISS
jgi:hypothetical protein